MLARFLKKHYQANGKVFRRCQPRDIISHALNLIHFEKLPFALTDEILKRAFHSCFLEENASEEAPDTPIMPVHSAPAPVPVPVAAGGCTEYWAGKLARHASLFEVLLQLGRSRYRDEESERKFGAAETARVLEEQHRQRFVQWRTLGRERQARDLKKYLETSALAPRGLNGRLDEWVALLMPASSGEAARCLLAHDLAMLMAKLAPEDDLAVSA